MLASLLRPRAFYDLESIAVYLGEALGLPHKAREVYAKVVEAIDLLCELPDLGRPFDDEMLHVKGVRTYRVGAYRTFYSHDDTTLTVWRVIHMSQDLDDFALVDLAD